MELLARRLAQCAQPIARSKMAVDAISAYLAQGYRAISASIDAGSVSFPGVPSRMVGTVGTVCTLHYILYESTYHEVLLYSTYRTVWRVMACRRSSREGGE